MLDAASPEPHQAAALKTVDILIVGTGFAGLTAAIKLQEAGFGDLLLIEKADEVGGTWRENTYPGAACDIPSHLYSLSFAPKADWSRLYPQQPELLAYLRDVAARYALRPLIRFGTAMTAARWDEARARWLVSTTTGPIEARVLIGGMGPLHWPVYAPLPGVEAFAGTRFHSAEWDHGYDLAGKRIAVIGTGASAVQFIPQIAKEAAHVTVFQRTPPWIMPRRDRPIPAERQAQFRRNPLRRRLFRQYLFWFHEIRVLGFLGNKAAQRAGARIAARNIAKHIKDPALRAKVTPAYALGCKRTLVSDDYYPALARPNVDLVTAGVREVRAHSILDEDGAEHPVDAIIYGTGFEVTTSFRHLRLQGTAGRELNAVWEACGMQAHKGITVSGFPNWFLLLGPNSGLGHNSVILMIESQVRYIADLLSKMRAKGIRAVDVKPAAQARFVAELHKRMARTVWQEGGCRSWYMDAAGRNTTLWPGSVLSYRAATKAAALSDYEPVSAAPPPAQ